MSEKSNSMLEGSLFDKIFFFAMPLAASSILQQLFNAADSAVVGRFAGSEALAAVGANASIISLFVNCLVGLSIGANVVIAQHIGANRMDKIKDSIETVVLFSVLQGLCVTAIGFILSRFILGAIGTPSDVISLAEVYLRVYLLGIPFISLFNFGSAILRSSGDTKRPMYCLIVAGILNVLLNLLLVIVFHLSVVGVAIATVSSNVVSAGMVIFMLMKEKGILHLDIRNLHISKDPLLQMLKTGVPAALQSMVFSVANISIQSGVNSFGSEAIAGSAAATNFELFDYHMVNAFNQAAVTFVGQNYAAKQYDRCKRIFKVCMIEGLIGILSMEAIFFIGRNSFIRLFTTQEAVIGYALTRMMCCMLPHFLMSTYEITGSVLRGMGYSMLPALLTVIGSVGFRVLWLFTVFKIWNSFTGLLMVYPASWILTGVMVVTAYIIVSKKALKEA